MRNINEFNRIRTINVEERVADVAAGSGTFKEILDKVLANEIIPIVSGSGMIVGISYDSKVTNLIDDNVAQVAFEKRYRGKDVMGYVLAALKLKADDAAIADVQEDAQRIRVILDNGEVVTIKDYAPCRCSESNSSEVTPSVELPSEVEISVDEFGGADNVTEDSVKRYLREAFDHYLSGNHVAPDYSIDNDVVKVTNIYWGRKR